MPDKAPPRRRAAPLSTLAQWLRHAESRFRRARLAFGHGTGNARDEAAWLLLHVLGNGGGDLDSCFDRVLTREQRKRARALIAERIRSRRPLAQLLGEAWLAGRRFYLDERVIVPRSHIAGLLGEGLAPWIHEPARLRRALDMCTGSGCLAILIALAFPRAAVDAADVSSEALAVARRNVRDYRLQDRVRLLRSDLFAGLEPARYGLIVANPPYVDARSMAALPPEYRHEPALALDGGADGLDFVRRILAHARAYLSPRGVLVVEVGSRRKALERAFPELPFTWLETGDKAGSVFLLERADLTPRRNEKWGG